MTAKPKPDELETTRQKINRWRTTRTKLGPMPAELWDSAVALARKHSVGPVARTLGLGHASLKARVESGKRTAGGKRRQRACRGARLEQAGFVEVLSTPVASTVADGTTVVEVSAPNGTRLLIRLPQGHFVDVVGLVTCFRDQS